MGEREQEGKKGDGKKREKKCCDFCERVRGQVFLLMSLSFWFVLCFSLSMARFRPFLCAMEKNKNKHSSEERKREPRSKVLGFGGREKRRG
jgi:hypothetical protein